MLIGKGRILSDGTLADLRNFVHDERYLVVDFDEDPGAFTCPDTETIGIKGRQVRLRFRPSYTTAAALIRTISDRYAVKDVFVENPPIERVIAEYYRMQEIE